MPAYCQKDADCAAAAAAAVVARWWCLHSATTNRTVDSGAGV